MKTELYPEPEDGEDEAEGPEGSASVDWRDSPDEVLREVDAQLAAFGLNVVMFDTGGDEYVWCIRKIVPTV